MSAIAIKQAKKVLRSEISKKIKSLSYENKLKQSKVVQQNLLAHEEWIKSRRVSLYLNTEDEVCTLELLRAGFESHKSMFIPRYSKSRMEMLQIASMDDYASLPTTSWNIKQPLIGDESRQVINPQNGGLDLILMPGVAFTKEGVRLGRGGGYYDSYLNHYKHNFGILPFLIAPTFKQQILPSIPSTELDVKIDVLLFDEKADDE